MLERGLHSLCISGLGGLIFGGLRVGIWLLRRGCRLSSRIEGARDTNGRKKAMIAKCLFVIRDTSKCKYTHVNLINI